MADFHGLPVHPSRLIVAGESMPVLALLSMNAWRTMNALLSISVVPDWGLSARGRDRVHTMLSRSDTAIGGHAAPAQVVNPPAAFGVHEREARQVAPAIDR